MQWNASENVSLWEWVGGFNQETHMPGRLSGWCWNYHDISIFAKWEKSSRSLMSHDDLLSRPEKERKGSKGCKESARQQQTKCLFHVLTNRTDDVFLKTLNIVIISACESTTTLMMWCNTFLLLLLFLIFSMIDYGREMFFFLLHNSWHWIVFSSPSSVSWSKFLLHVAYT